MSFIDMHCDTLLLPFMKKKEGSLRDFPEAMVDLKRLSGAGAVAQFFAIFLPDWELAAGRGWDVMEDEPYIKLHYEYFTKELEAHSDLALPATNAEEIRSNRAAGKVSAVLTMEDGRAVDGRMENLERFYDMGIRAISLTWNSENCFGYPNSKDAEVMGKGLKSFGKEAVRRMQELGILVDVSHLSDGGFMDVADVCTRPFVATHSNCRTVCPHTRNLTDDMIKVLAGAGGVSGLNFGPDFVDPNRDNPVSSAALLALHARHMADVGGVDVVALGSDFDGVGGDLEISDCSKVALLADALEREGFRESEIEKILWKNSMRVIEAAMN